MEGLLYFAQRAEELLFDYTLDSYKPLALNASSLCEEALALIDDVESNIIDQSNLRPVLEELSWSIAKDPVAKSLLDLPRDAYLLDPASEPLFRVRLKLDVLGRTLEQNRYLDRCMELLSEAVKSARKADIDLLAGLLYTTLANIGLHKTHLYEKTIDYFYKGRVPEAINSSDAIDDYLAKIYPVRHEFDVFFLASSLIAGIKDSAEEFRISCVPSFPDNLLEFAVAHSFQPSGSEAIVKVENLQAFDCYTARERAGLRLGHLRDLFTLYHHKNQIEWRAAALIKQCCLDEPRIVSLPRNPIEKGYDQRPEHASQKLIRMLKTFRLRGNDFRKFSRAVDFHGLAVNNGDPENQLLNLWIALETIVPSHAGGAKIRQITEGLLPFVSMNYIWRLVGNLAKDLLRWNTREAMRILRDVPGAKRAHLRKRLFVLLTSPECQGLRERLFASLKDFHLLRFRIFSMARALESPKKALGLLRQHEQRVEWQIRRIYRTRNLIVHSGRTPVYIQTLIENGHDYLDQVLGTIIRMSGSSYRISAVAQAFELAHVARRRIEQLLSSDAYTPEAMAALMNEYDFLRADGHA